ncbi:transposase [Streptomyces nodosus]|uniref:transposase n=1 Tax=Streptomyces nodosus TaxID=40318 RepID=UPI0038048849
MTAWWLVLISRSSSDSATTGLGKSGYQSLGALLLVMIRDLVLSFGDEFVEVVGIGPNSAAALLIAAGDNPERVVGEASFAALCGASPVEQSSGKTQRRRLNRGGNRQTNAALYRIVMTRIRWDERTRSYLERRTKQGMSRREIVRCLKRYVAREVFRHIQPITALPLPDPAA